MIIHVFTRIVNAAQADKDLLVTLLEKVAEQFGLIHKAVATLEVIDIDIKDYTQAIDVRYAIAFGRIAANAAKSLSPREICILPTLDKLQPVQANAKNRKLAWDALLDFLKSIRVTQDVPTEQKATQEPPIVGPKWAILRLKDGKEICVYEGEKPNTPADFYLSRADCQLLLQVKDAFKAEFVELAKMEGLDAGKGSVSRS